jgi:hypothetical protein
MYISYSGFCTGRVERSFMLSLLEEAYWGCYILGRT